MQKDEIITKRVASNLLVQQYTLMKYASIAAIVALFLVYAFPKSFSYLFVVGGILFFGYLIYKSNKEILYLKQKYQLGDYKNGKV